jgi:hypothetical protein
MNPGGPLLRRPAHLPPCSRPRAASRQEQQPPSAAGGLSQRTTNERADRPHADCCFALAEQSSQEPRPAQLVLVRGDSELRIESPRCFCLEARARSGGGRPNERRAVGDAMRRGGQRQGTVDRWACALVGAAKEGSRSSGRPSSAIAGHCATVCRRSVASATGRQWRVRFPPSPPCIGRAVTPRARSPYPDDVVAGRPLDRVVRPGDSLGWVTGALKSVETTCTAPPSVAMTPALRRPPVW